MVLPNKTSMYVFVRLTMLKYYQNQLHQVCNRWVVSKALLWGWMYKDVGEITNLLTIRDYKRQTFFLKINIAVSSNSRMPCQYALSGWPPNQNQIECWLGESLGKCGNTIVPTSLTKSNHTIFSFHRINTPLFFTYKHQMFIWYYHST